MVTKRLTKQLLSLGLIIGMAAIPVGLAAAHEGHAGQKMTLVETRAALKALLPSGTKVVKRKEAVGEATRRWAIETFSTALDDTVESYYLARDGHSGAIQGTALISEIDYRHGQVRIALGLDDEHHISGVAILSVHEKYLPELDKTIGTGFLPGYQGLSVTMLLEMLSPKTAEQTSDNKASGNKAGEIIAGEIGRMAVLLVALTRQAANQASK